ncbi:hypothetical protein vBVpP1_39 [Vibrio phage vB_VpP_1]|nr:hypothetical protein vBVpP1_39 [Vibrio phage vB_VpP_1]
MTSSIRVPDTITPLGDFPVVESKDVGGFSTLEATVNEHNEKITKNITQILELAKRGKTFTYSGNTAPDLSGEAHGNYLLVFRAMDQTLSVTTPNPVGGVPDGTMFTIYNDDTDNAVRLTAGNVADKLNGGAISMNIPPENFVSFTYKISDRDFVLLESGYIPAARINIANYIEQKLNADGKLHTEAELETAGFLKGMQVSGDQVSNVRGAKWIHFQGATVSAGKTDQAVVTVHGEVDPTKSVLHFQTIAERNQWSSANGSKYTKVVCIVDRDDNGFVAWYEWDGSKWSEYDAQGVVMSDSDGAIPKNIKTVVFGPGFAIQQAGDQEDAALVTYTEQGGGNGSITLVDDGGDEIPGVNKLHIKGMMITETPNQGGYGPGEAQITSGINWHMAEPDQQYGSSLANEVVVLPPLNTYIDPDKSGAESVKLEIKPGTFEAMQSPSFLAYLQESVEVTGKLDIHGQPTGHPKGAVWFDDVVVPSGPYIALDKVNKAYGIQEADELDPNVSGGMNYLICYRMAFKGKAPNDGFVRIYLREKQVGQQGQNKLLLDVNGHPMAVERYYKAGDKLGHLDVIGVVNAKSIIEFQALSEDSFTDDILNIEDRENGASGLMIQALKSDDKTGRAFLQYMHDTGQDIVFNSHYLGPDRMSIKWYESFDQPLVDHTAGSNQTLTDGMEFYIVNDMKSGSVDGHIVFQDNGTDIADFHFGKIFSADETRMLRGRVVTVTATLTDKDDAYNISLMKWSGKPDEFTNAIFTSRDNNIPEWTDGWSLVDTLFISEDAVSGEHTATKDFTVPADANNYAVIIYPVSAQSPMTLKLKQFELDVKDPFVGFDIHAPVLDSEKHLIYSDEHKQFSQDSQGFASLRYTINSDEGFGLPMPIGMVKGGNADIELDTSATVANISGSQAKGGEGCIKFNADGNARIVSNLRLWNEKSTDSIVKFWWAEVSPDGSSVKKLPDSVFTATVKAGAKGTHYAFGYDHDVEQGDRLSLRASVDASDGAFLQATPSVTPMLSNYIEFKELKDSGDDPFASVIDYSQFDRVYTGILTATKMVANASSVTFNLDIPDDMNISVLSAVKELKDLSVRPVRALDWVYSNKDKTLTVSFGETVLLGQVTIGIYT